jgi:hypothetical protein
MEKINNVNPEDLDTLVQRLFEAREEIEAFAKELSTNDTAGLEAFRKLKDDFQKKLSTLSTLVPPDDSGDAARIALKELAEAFSKEPVANPSNVLVQTQNILFALNKVEKSGLHLDTSRLDFHHEFEKLKLKLEIIVLQLTLSKLVVGAAFQMEFRRAFKRIGSLRQALQQKIVNRKKNVLTALKEESQKIYSAMNKSLKHLGGN